MDRRVKESKVAVPVRPIRELAAEAAGDLKQTIARLTNWGVRVPAASRARTALEVLEHVASSGQFTSEQRGDDTAIRALQLSMDLRAITDSLPTDLVAELRRDLEKCVAGKLAFDPDDLEPSQFQSQLIIRAAFAKMGVVPLVPTKAEFSGGKRPDILVENGVSRYGIEVKRPTKASTVLSNAARASTQIGEPGLKGGVILDVTDCLLGIPPTEVDDVVLKHYEQTSALFFENGVGFKPGQSHMLFAGVLARPMWTVSGVKGDAMVAVHSTSAIGAFGTRPGTLDFRRATWLRETINDGLNQIGFTSVEEA